MDPKDPLIEFEKLQQLMLQVETWLFDDLLVLPNLVQLITVIALLLVARKLAPGVRRRLEAWSQRGTGGATLSRPLSRLALISFPLLWLLLQWIAAIVAESSGWPHALLTVTVSLLTAWVVIRVVSTLIRDPVWSRALSTVAWGVAALNIVGWLDSTVELLESISVTIGGLTITALAVIQAVISLAIMLWLASIASRMFEQRIRSTPNLTPSVQVLFAKLMKITLFAFAFVAALSSVGIDLTALAVFSGAIGVGIGFGLQKIVSNMISGVILLLDKSIKPGDVITVGNYYGSVNSLGARYVSVLTRDGIEHLIPNEEIITQRVENWSYSDNLVRLRKLIGVHYQADVRKAIALCLEAADEVERVLSDPKPACLLRDFGESSVDLELRFWIQDPQNGRANVTSEILLRIWDKFHANGIEIPYPQRDLHIRTPGVVEAGLPVALAGPKSAPVEAAT